jgi:hypothetical protein
MTAWVPIRTSVDAIDEIIALISWMPKPEPEVGPISLGTTAAAAFVGIPPSRLIRMRRRGQGPPHRWFGRRIKYERLDLRRWQRAHGFICDAAPHVSIERGVERIMADATAGAQRSREQVNEIMSYATRWPPELLDEPPPPKQMSWRRLGN